MNKKSIKLAGLFTLTFVLMVSSALMGLEMPRTPTAPESTAFLNLSNGVTAWPVWKIANNKIKIDGKVDETEWAVAQKIYITGEWFWNEKALNYRSLYTSLADFIAVWRVLYDDSNLYISCQFYDDKHVEGSAFAPWYRNDAVELTFVQPTIVGQTNSMNMNAIIQKAVLRLWRRFTPHPGLIGQLMNGLDTIRYPGAIADSGWSATEPDSAVNRLGGIHSAARPFTNTVFPGAWAVEFVVPFAAPNLPSGSVPIPVPANLYGQRFQMNLKVCDNDTVAADRYLNIGMERFAHPWWPITEPSSSTITETDMYPNFVFAGEKDIAARGLNPGTITWPDEFNLYCGKTYLLYDTILDAVTNASETGFGPERLGSLNVYPNPFTAASTIRFNLEKAGRAGFKLFDARGSLVLSSGEKNYPAGRNAVSLNAGSRLVPGDYFLRMDADNARFVKKISVLH